MTTIIIFVAFPKSLNNGWKDEYLCLECFVMETTKQTISIIDSGCDNGVNEDCGWCEVEELGDHCCKDAWDLKNNAVEYDSQRVTFVPLSHEAMRLHHQQVVWKLFDLQ